MKRALLGLLVFVSSIAHADEDLACHRVRSEGLNDGPIVIGLYDAEFGTGRRTCLRSEMALYERGGAVLDYPGLYGGVTADTVLAGSFRLRPRIEIFGAIALVHWELVQNAAIIATDIGLGQGALGIQGLILETRRFAMSGYGRVMVPLATYSAQVQSTGAEIGLSGLFRPRRDVDLHAQLAGDFTAALNDSPSPVRGGTSISIGVQFSPATWFALAVDLQTVLGHRAALDALLPMLALRFRVWRGLGLELAAMSPVVGADRQLALAALRVGYRF